MTSTNRTRKKTSQIWAYYSIVNDFKNVAKCDVCDREVSFRSTTNNLKKHIERKHPSVVCKPKPIKSDEGNEITLFPEKFPVEEGEVVEDPPINENKSTADDQVPVIVEFVQAPEAVKGGARRKESARRLYERIAASACGGEAPGADDGPAERALKRRILETELEIRREELSFKRSLHRLQLDHEARANSVRLQLLERQLGL
ncbi:uncharacterized protein LOC134540203 [Bacillus rossius redtenbacheri]|uniref:uncharacterized protein LOC134540203 n=1 Tax=Bacillus rossius redtenbacheri TaxID=93214 RepID=UPI002FDC99BC